jgi:excisionase family DNA binding protein
MTQNQNTFMNTQLPGNSSHTTRTVDGRSVEPSGITARCEALLDSTEAAQLLRIHPKTLQRMARNRQIPAIKIGKLWRYSPSALLQWQQKKLAG